MSSDPPASSDFPAYSEWSASADWPAEPAASPAGSAGLPPVYSDWSGYGDWPQPSGLPGSGDVPGVSDLPGSGDVPGVGDLPGSGDVPGVGDLPPHGDLARSGDRPAVPASAAPAVPSARAAHTDQHEPSDLPGPGDPSAAPDARVANRPPARGWRFLISPKWLGWHALMIVLVAAMLALGDWQLRRAEAGNALSWAYTFEWPIFAGFVVVFWVKTIRDEFHPPTWPEWTYSEGVELPAAAAARSETGGSSDEDEDEDEELAAYNAYLARLTTEVRGHGKWHGLR